MLAGGMQRQHIRLHLGKLFGDLLKVQLKDLPKRVDLLVAGPPCPPWSSQGKKESLKDARAQVFVRILVWVFYLVHCGGLLGVVLDNVTGILSTANGEAVMTMFLRILREFVPEFTWRVDTLAATQYMCPQTRARVFLRGMRRIIASLVPPPLPPFGKRSLRSALGRLPNTPRCSFTGPQRKNLKAGTLSLIIYI